MTGINVGDDKHHVLLKCGAISNDLLLSVTICHDLSGPIAHDVTRMGHERIRADASKYEQTRPVMLLSRTLTICYEVSRPYTHRARLMHLILRSTTEE